MAESSKLQEDRLVSSQDNQNSLTPSTCEAGNSNNVEESSPSSSHAEPEFDAPQVGEVVLKRLARQLEYYFSSSNLSKDTYVSTLRSLNDGYVPISILANFGKVKALVPYDGLNAVGKAASGFSDLLEVVEIDPKTGKRANKNNDTETTAVGTIEAVGPISGEPIPFSGIPRAPVSPPVVRTVAPAVQNTVIVREVPEGTEESHVRDLFAFEKCPPIRSLHLDVANCWFVTLDTESRDDMVNVMFALRSMKFASDEPVKARLKSGVVMNSDSPSNGGFVPDMNQMMYPPQSSSRYYNNGGRKNKKKKNSPKTRTNGTSMNSPNKNNGKAKNVNNNNGTRRSNNGGKQKKPNGQERPQQLKQEARSSPNASNEQAPSPQAPPLTLGEEQFPALPSEDPMNSTKIEVTKVPEQRPEDDSCLEKNGGGNSDSASTATTTSSSSSSKNQAIGGYAAALLKAAPAKPLATEKENRSTKAEKKVESKKDVTVPISKKESIKQVETTEPSPVVVKPPSWGGGRSFADVLRKENAASVAASKAQSA